MKKPAREEEAFRAKLEETLEEVDRVRRDAAAFKLSALEGAARQFEDSLHDLRSRSSLERQRLPAARGQARPALRSIRVFEIPDRLDRPGARQRRAVDGAAHDGQRHSNHRVAEIRGGKADGEGRTGRAALRARRGSLDNTLQALTDHVAQEHNKTVILECTGLQLVPPQYQAAIKNIAIQLIRNAVMHGIETPAAREAAGKPAHGTLRLEFKSLPERGFELLFEDDGCGLDPDRVRATAIARGVITGEAAARLRDREAIKLIFKSGFTTLPTAPGDTTHGTGMSLVRRYVHEAGGKIALASLLGHETRFKVTLPPLAGSCGLEVA